MGCIGMLISQTRPVAVNEKGVSPSSGLTEKITVQNTYALVVGISDYLDPGIPDLRFADKDAEAFASYLRSEAGGRLDADHLKLLTNHEATVAQFAIALDWLMEVAKENDQVIIYFSGHGDVEKKTITQPGYLLCCDAPSRIYLAGGALALPMFQDIITTLSLQNKAKVMVITDACRSGKLAGSSVGGSQITGSNLAKQYANEIKMLSCQPNEYSIEGEQWGGGRGAFSYHLIDALYGMADNNHDLMVNLQEAGRYIEDHVSAEVAPVSQIPIVIGNKMDKLSKVVPSLLESIRSGKSSQIAFLSGIESRGLEEEVLSRVDSSVRLTYRLFKQALKNKEFLEPVNACAEAYYNKLIHEPNLEKLHSTIKRNYAAALQDDAQNILNMLLRKGIEKMLTNAESKGESYSKLPKLLDRAAELLGKDHYLYNSLMARKYFFESYQVKSRELKLEKCRLSLNHLEDFPLAYWRLASIHIWDFGSYDSAQYYSKKAIASAPNWIRPYIDLGKYCFGAGLDSLSEIYFDKAYKIDSTSAVLWYTKGISHVSYRHQNDQGIFYYEKALRSANTEGLCFPCIYINLSSLVWLKGDSIKAIELCKEGLKNDPYNKILMSNIGAYYIDLRLFDSANYYNKLVVKMYPDYRLGWLNLTNGYFLQKKYKEGEQACLEALKIYPDDPDILENYANIQSATGRKTEAVSNYKKSLKGFIQKYAFETAEKILKKLMNIDSLDTDIKNLKLEFENKYQNKNERIAYGFRMLLYDSTDVKNWNYIGDGYRELEDYTSAIYYYNRSLKLDSTQVIPLINRGFCLDESKQTPQAVADYLHVLAIDSMESTALNNLGRIYLRIGAYEKAKSLLLRAISVNSSFANPHKHLGMLYFKLGQFEPSKQELQKAIALDPHYALAYLGMANVLNAERKTDEAFTYIGAAIREKASFEQLEKDSELSELRSMPAWKELMMKYFPDKLNK